MKGNKKYKLSHKSRFLSKKNIINFKIKLNLQKKKNIFIPAVKNNNERKIRLK